MPKSAHGAVKKAATTVESKVSAKATNLSGKS